MNKALFSVLIPLILIAFVAQSANAHGPSRQKVVEKIEIGASPDKIWDIVKNFSKKLGLCCFQIIFKRERFV